MLIKRHFRWTPRIFMNLKHRACGGRPACNHSFAAPDSFLTAMRSSGKATAALPTTKQWSLGLQLVGYVTKAHGKSSPRREAIGEIPFERHLHQASLFKRCSISGKQHITHRKIAVVFPRLGYTVHSWNR